MRITFDKNLYTAHEITPEKIAEEIEMIGFGAELLEIIENDQEDLLR